MSIETKITKQGQDSELAQNMARELGKSLKEQGLTIAVAESCTGGLISHTLTNIPGSSKYFKLGVVAYSSEMKRAVLEVSPETLCESGVVSHETALAMAEGVRRLGKCDVGVGVTGIAGPEGGSDAVPIGTVYIAVSTERNSFWELFQFTGSRLDIKNLAAGAALKMIDECIE